MSVILKLTTFLTFILVASFSAHATLPKLTDWPRHGQDITNSQANPLSSLNISNAKKVFERCRINYVRGAITQGDVESTSSQPIIVNDVIYWTGFGGQVGATKLIRNNKDQVVSCQDLWVKDVSTELGLNITTTEPAVRVSPAYYITKSGKGALLYTGVASGFTLPTPLDSFNTPVYAFALDAQTGQKLFQIPIGDPGSVNPDNAFANATSSPIVYNNVAYFGLASFNNVYYATFFGGYALTFRGQIVALDLLGIGNSGQPFVKWKQYTVPARPANWSGPWFSGGGVWASGASVLPLAGKDHKGLLITGSGQLYSYPAFVRDCMMEPLPAPLQFSNFTATKKGEIGSGAQECYVRAQQTLKQMGINAPIATNSIIALNIKDGSYAWYYPTAGIDAWQGFCGDEATGGPFCTVEIAGPDWDVGGSAPVLTLVDLKPTVISHNKGGEVFVLDALTGAKKLRLDVCVGSPSGGIHWGISYDALRGQILANCSGGKFTEAFDSNIIYSSALADGRVVCQRGYLNAIDVRTGKLKWQVVAPQSDTAAEVCPSVGYAPDLRFKYGIAFDRVIKNKPANVSVVQLPRSNTIPNQFPGKGRLHTPAAITSNMILLPAYLGSVYLLNANNGAYLNELHCDRGALYQGVAVTKDVVSFGCGYDIFGGPNDAGNNIMVFSLDKK